MGKYNLYLDLGKRKMRSNVSNKNILIYIWSWVDRENFLTTVFNGSRMDNKIDQQTNNWPLHSVSRKKRSIVMGP